MSLVRFRPKAPLAGLAHLAERDLAKVEVASSSLVARSRKKHHPSGWCFFLERRFCCAKSVACGRVIERERGNPSKAPPHTPPSLQYTEGAGNKTCGQSQNTTLSGGVFFVCASALTVVSAGCRRLRFSAYCAIFRVVMTRKWGRRTRFRQNNRYFAFFLAMEKSMWYTDAEYNSECAGGCIAVDLVRPYCALLPETFAPMIEIRCIGDGATSLHRTEG